MKTFKEYSKETTLSEGVKVIDKEKLYSKSEAAKALKCKEDQLIFSDRVIKGKGVWINDETSDAVLSKEKPKELLGKYRSK